MGSLEISQFRPRPSPRPTPDAVRASAVHPRLAAGRFLVSMLCAALSLSLHIALLTSVIGGGRSLAPQKPDIKLLGDATADQADASAMQWVVLDELSNGNKSGRVAESFFPSAVIALPDPHVDLPAVLASSPEQPSELSAAADTSAASQLFGGYLGQIDARIERAWIRPRTPIGAPEFSCRARIAQDPAGNITKVTLERCNGDDRWKRSLLNGIHSASPLPAPPDPRVFARVIHLGFHSDPYSASAPQALYETEVMATRAVEDARYDTQKALSEFRTSLQRADRVGGVVNLRLEGRPTDPPPPQSPPSDSTAEAPGAPDSAAAPDAPQLLDDSQN